MRFRLTPHERKVRDFERRYKSSIRHADEAGLTLFEFLNPSCDVCGCAWSVHASGRVDCQGYFDGLEKGASLEKWCRYQFPSSPEQEREMIEAYRKYPRVPGRFRR